MPVHVYLAAPIEMPDPPIDCGPDMFWSYLWGFCDMDPSFYGMGDPGEYAHNYY